jgi:hypothetical protein
VAATTDTSFDSQGPVPVALDLGWEMAELYTDATVRGQAAEPAKELPTLSGLREWQRTDLSLAHIEAALHRLSSAITDAGLDVPTLNAVTGASGGGSNAALKSALSDLHYQLFKVLHAADPNLGKAYDLGRSLAYTSHSPHDAATLRAEFEPARLDVLKGWLADLATALPDHASRAVAISIGIWQQAIPDPGDTSKSWQVHDDEVHRTQLQLHRQAKLWRAVLTGGKAGTDMLQASDYVAAAGRLFEKATRLLGRFIVQTYFLVPLILGGAGYGIWAILTSHGKTAANIVGAVTAGAAALGITWTGARTTLLQLAAKLQEPLWNAELDAAIAQAITPLETNRRALRPAKIAAQIAPPAGPRLTESPPSAANENSGPTDTRQSG